MGKNFNKHKIKSIKDDMKEFNQEEKIRLARKEAMKVRLKAMGELFLAIATAIFVIYLMMK
jgi:hypothetical protein